MRVIVKTETIDDVKRATAMLEVLGFSTEVEADDDASAEAWALESITRQCKLTSREAALLVHVWSGKSVDEARELLGVSRPSVAWLAESLRIKLAQGRSAPGRSLQMAGVG